MTGYCYHQFTEAEAITLPAGSIAANRAYGAFDFFGVRHRQAFYLHRHLERFFTTMSLMRLKIKYSPEQLQALVHEIIQRCQEDDFYIKLFAYPIDTFSGSEIPAELFIIPLVLPIDTRFNYNTGIMLISKEYQRFLPEAKSTNYLPLVYWQHEIDLAGAADVLYYNAGIVSETSRGNVFLVKNGKVFTPARNMLKGITRSIILDLLQEKGEPCIERDIAFDELFTADEVFLSGTTKKVLPVTCIDHRIIHKGQIGPTSQWLMSEFESLLGS